MKDRDLIIIALVVGALMIVIGYFVSKQYDDGDTMADSFVGNIKEEQNSRLNIQNYDNYGTTTETSSNVEDNTVDTETIVTNEKNSPLTTINVKIDGTNYQATLFNNETAKELLKLFPMEITMSEMNGNEKFSYLSTSFTQGKERIKDVKSGDIVLYGTNCLVIFYKDVNTSELYTKIGEINAPDGLDYLGNVQNVEINFSNTSN